MIRWQVVLLGILWGGLMVSAAQGQTLVNQSGKNWGVSVGTYFVYDDNVINVIGC